MSDFDFGCNEEEIGGANNIRLWPREGRRTALVDADALAYTIGYVSDMTDYLAWTRAGKDTDDRQFEAKKEQLSSLLNKWIDNAGCDSALLYFTDSSSNFRLDIKTDNVYKGERPTEKPPYWEEMKDWLMEFHDGHMSDGREADDDISIEAWRRHKVYSDGHDDLWDDWHKEASNFVVVSNDKDLCMIPGWQCPPKGSLYWATPLGSLDPIYKEKQVIDYEFWPLFGGKPVNLKHCSVPMMYGGTLKLMDKDALKAPKKKWECDHVWCDRAGQQDTYQRGKNKGVGKFKRVKVGTKPSSYMDKLKGTGLMFFYSQVLTGDTADEYKGLPDCGMTGAYAILEGASNEQELVARVRQAYEEVYKNPDEALLKMTTQGRLAWMQTSEDDVWSVPSLNEQSFPL